MEANIEHMLLVKHNGDRNNCAVREVECARKRLLVEDKRACVDGPLVLTASINTNEGKRTYFLWFRDRKCAPNTCVNAFIIVEDLEGANEVPQFCKVSYTLDNRGANRVVERNSDVAIVKLATCRDLCAIREMKIAVKIVCGPYDFGKTARDWIPLSLPFCDKCCEGEMKSRRSSIRCMDISCHDSKRRYGSEG